MSNKPKQKHTPHSRARRIEELETGLREEIHPSLRQKYARELGGLRGVNSLKRMGKR